MGRPAETDATTLEAGSLSCYNLILIITLYLFLLC